MPDSRVQIACGTLQGAVNCLLSFPFQGKGADRRIGVIFTLRAVLPRLIAAEGALSFLLIEKKQKIKAWN
jgi:hypothetical protein